LLDATLRFNELRRRLPTATQRMLTRQLRELEECGLVHRQVFPQVPPRVDYSLTAEGKSLAPIILEMHDWGERRLAKPRKAGRA
jgi:DNA-binding HxlR family transcriptional regulator